MPNDANKPKIKIVRITEPTAAAMLFPHENDATERTINVIKATSQTYNSIVTAELMVVKAEVAARIML